MANSELELLKQEIDLLREQMYAYMEYPEIFKDELLNDCGIIDYVKKLGIKVGLAINPETSINELYPYIDDVDLILFMSVKPGYGGQPFKEEVIDKIKSFKKMAPSDLVISVDGGINDKTISLCKYAGCDMVVAGSFITNSDNYDEKIRELR